jgi:CubicO group peptidase (beta-lactamase class C family)
MQLVEEGVLSLDAEVNAYLDFEIPDTFAEPITLEHLMTHTPGFEDMGEGLFFLDEEKLVSLEDYVKDYRSARVYPPGVVAAYSNYGTALAGYIVQRVSGIPFEAYVEEHIFAPLGMDQSTFQPLPAATAHDMSQGYGFSQGAFVQGEFELISGSPAGALSAAGADMAPFRIAHLQGGAYGSQRILEGAKVERMQAAHYVPDPRTYGFGYEFFRNRMNERLIVSRIRGKRSSSTAAAICCPTRVMGSSSPTTAAAGRRHGRSCWRRS